MPSQPALRHILVILYFVSGATALGYEILWARMLSLQFGVSIFGVVVTVGSFMIGLGAGSLAAARWGSRVARPVFAFGLLECGVGVFALAMPFLAQLVSASIAGFTANLGLASWYVAYAGVDTVLMALPSLAMGAAFPLILRGAERVGVSVAKMYGFNALGGVVGAVLPVVLMPAWGWAATAQGFAVLGLLVGGAALMASRFEVRGADNAAAPGVVPDWRTPALYAAVGGGALMLEIGWTRLFGMVLLRTEYVLAIIVAVFLAGIGLGSVIARHLRAAPWMIVLPTIASACAIGTLWVLPMLSRWVETSFFTSLEAALVAQGLLLAVLTMPATLAFGAWLPLLADQGVHRTHAAATLYGANSLGAAAGAFVAGFALIPLIGTTATVIVAALLVALAGLALARASVRYIAPSAIVLVAIALPVVTFPAVRDLFPRAHGDAMDVMRHEDAVTTTHVVQYRDGHRVLLDDLQRMDASSEPDAVELQKNQARLPLLLHPNPKAVLFLGLGTGISVSGALGDAQRHITAVELSRGAIRAAREWFGPVNGRVLDYIAVRRDDARRALLDRSAAYDVIIGDLFHPDIAGRSALLSSEQFRRARDRLADGGVFAQWIALNQLDVATLDTILRTFKEAFPNGGVFIDPFRLVLVGRRDGKLTWQSAMDPTRPAPPDDPSTGGEGIWTWAGRYMGRLDDVVSADGPTQSELHPRIEFQLPKARYRGELDIATSLQYLLKHRPAWTRAADDLQIPPPARDRFERAYSATELAMASWIATMKGRAAEGSQLMRLAYQANPLDRWIGVALVAPVWDKLQEIRPNRDEIAKVFGKDEREVIEAILAQRPDFVPALKALENMESRAGNSARAAALRQKLQILSPLDAELAR